MLSKVDRRSLLSAGAFGAVAIASGTQATPSKAASNGVKSVINSKKDWARKNLRGCEAFILPSMSSDFSRIDEEGVRRDVRHAIAQGMRSVLPVGLGLPQPQARQLIEIIADEARGKLLVLGSLMPSNWEAQAAGVRHAERLGCTHAIIVNDPNLKTQDEIYNSMRSVIDQTSMAVVLYAQPIAAWKSLDPSAIPLDAFSRLADHPNVVGVKLTQVISPAAALAVADRLADRLLISVIDFELMMALALKYPMQWTGQWAVDTLQGPDKRYAVQFMELMSQGKLKEARALYWQFEPAARAFYALQDGSLRAGGHPWVHIKYLQWLTGGNGGLMPDLKESLTAVPHLDAAAREACRRWLQSIGLPLTERPEEAFIVGNAAYDRGVRRRDLAGLPQYVA